MNREARRMHEAPRNERDVISTTSKEDEHEQNEDTRSVTPRETITHYWESGDHYWESGDGIPEDCHEIVLYNTEQEDEISEESLVTIFENNCIKVRKFYDETGCQPSNSSKEAKEKSLANFLTWTNQKISGAKRKEGGDKYSIGERHMKLIQKYGIDLERSAKYNGRTGYYRVMGETDKDDLLLSSELMEWQEYRKFVNSFNALLEKENYLVKKENAKKGFQRVITHHTLCLVRASEDTFFLRVFEAGEDFDSTIKPYRPKDPHDKIGVGRVKIEYSKEVPLPYCRGYKFWKYFPPYKQHKGGWYEGTITEVFQCEEGEVEKSKTRRVLYSDGDVEDLSMEEIQAVEKLYNKRKDNNTGEKVDDVESIEDGGDDVEMDLYRSTHEKRLRQVLDKEDNDSESQKKRSKVNHNEGVGLATSISENRVPSIDGAMFEEPMHNDDDFSIQSNEDENNVPFEVEATPNDNSENYNDMELSVNMAVNRLSNKRAANTDNCNVMSEPQQKRSKVTVSITSWDENGAGIIIDRSGIDRSSENEASITANPTVERASITIDRSSENGAGIIIDRSSENEASITANPTVERASITIDRSSENGAGIIIDRSSENEASITANPTVERASITAEGSSENGAGIIIDRSSENEASITANPTVERASITAEGSSENGAGIIIDRSSENEASITSTIPDNRGGMSDESNDDENFSYESNGGDTLTNDHTELPDALSDIFPPRTVIIDNFDREQRMDRYVDDLQRIVALQTIQSQNLMTNFRFFCIALLLLNVVVIANNCIN